MLVDNIFIADFLNKFSTISGQVEGVNIHKIKGKGRGTVKYTGMKKNIEGINIIINDNLYLPVLNTIRASLQ